MRLGLSTVLTAALAVGLMACSSSTGDGEGGSGGGTGGAGSGGDDSSSSQGGAGTGGDTATGTGGGGGGEPATCDPEVTAPDAACSDADCSGIVFEDGGDQFCTALGCESAADCGAEGVDCAEVEDAEGNLTGACVFSCADGATCPDGFVCDDAETGSGTLFCFPG